MARPKKWAQVVACDRRTDTGESHEVGRRIHEAVDLGERHGLTGEPFAPSWRYTAAQRAGERVLARSR